MFFFCTELNPWKTYNVLENFQRYNIKLNLALTGKLFQKKNPIKQKN